MRILHIIGTLDPRAGGPPVVASSLAGAQASEGATVELISVSERSESVNSPINLTAHGLDLVKITRLGRSRLTPFLLPEMIKNAILRNDVVHIHGVWEPELPLVAHQAKRARKPFIVAPHGMLYPWSLKQKPIKKFLAFHLFYRKLLENASRVHVLNADEKDAIERLKIRSKYVIIPNGIFPADLTPLPKRGAFRRKCPELGDAPFVLFLSRLHPGKGLYELAEAFAVVCREHPTLNLVIIGPDFGASSNLRTIIGKHRLAGRVHILDPIYGKARFEPMVDAACFCLPSHHETFSMAVTEAMACATPVIITPQCHFPEVAEAGAGEVVELSINSLADAIIRVLSDSEKAVAFGQAGRRLVLDKFVWPAIACRTLAIYRDILADVS